MKKEKFKYPECLELMGLAMDEEFISSNHYHKLKCLECGNKFNAKPKGKMIHFKRTGRKGCKKCSLKGKDWSLVKHPPPKISNHQIKSFEFLRDVVKMKSIHGPIFLGEESKYKCLCCNKVFNYRGAYLLQRHKNYQSVGCPECSNRTKREPYIQEIIEKLSENYDILTNIQELFNVPNLSKFEITLKRKECGHEFTRSVHTMTYDEIVCPFCEHDRRKNLTGLYHADGSMVKKQPHSIEKITEMFQSRIEKSPIHFIVKDVNSYVGIDTKMTFICGGCENEWDATPSNVIHRGSGCPKCYKQNYSRVAIEWLEGIMKEEGIFIQHAENGGEVRVGIYFADGYCEETNTVYEFHGSYYHGDPTMFEDDDRPHPFKKQFTAKELHEQTMFKEQEIRNLGYNLVVMWESEYKMDKYQRRL